MQVQVAVHGTFELAATMTGARELLQRNLERILTTAGAEGVRIIKRDFRTTRSETSTGVITNRLRGAYDFKVEMAQSVGGVLRIGGLRGTENGRVPRHLPVHEGIDARGNQVSQFIIRPRRGKFLAIPLPAARTKGGASRGGPRMYPDTFVAFARGANFGIIYQKAGRDRVIPLFILKRQVTLRPRPSLPAVRARLAPYLTRRSADAASAALAGKRIAA